MFWFKKKKETKTPARAELLAQAKENARLAREAIGQDTLDRIAQSLQRKEQSPTEIAKAQIKAMDKDKVADHIKFMIDEK